MAIRNRAIWAVCIGLGLAAVSRADLLMLLEADKMNANPTVALDSSGNGAHAIFSNASIVDTGFSGGALNFTGNESFASLNSAAASLGALNSITTTQQFTIGFWMAGGESNPKNSSAFWADGATPNGGNRAIQAHASWGDGNLYYDIGGCCDPVNRVSDVLDEEYVKASVGDEWTHMAFTLDGDGFSTVYVNGESYLEKEGPTATVPALDQFFIASNNDGGNFWEGRMDDFFVSDNALTAADLASVVDTSARAFFAVTGEPANYTPQVLIANNELGSFVVPSSLSNITMGRPQLANGLTQYWFANTDPEGDVRDFVDNVGSPDFPLAARPFVTDTTWWAGSQDPNVISDLTLERYPAQLAGTPFDGSENEDNYAVRLTGEIWFPEAGDYLIRDGIDDFALIAIDQDGNGELDEIEDGANATTNQGPFGDVIVIDQDSATLEGGSQMTDFHGVAEVRDVLDGGEWRRIEVWMAEAGGGDGAVIYMGNLDDPELFDEFAADEPLTQEQRDAFVIRNEHLQTTIPRVVSGDALATLDTADVEYVVQLGTEGNDQLTVDDQGGVLTTTLDVSSARIRIEATDNIADGTMFTIFDADNLIGTDTVTFVFDDESKWDLSNLSVGIITFGAASCDADTMGDFDGNGIVEFADFLTLSSNFGKTVPDHTSGDADCSGTVEFADFLTLSSNFGKTVAGASQSIPEPSGRTLFAFALLLLRPFSSSIHRRK